MAPIRVVGCGWPDPRPVSYTHLDVYKRQVLYGQGDPGAIVDVQSKLANGERTREIEAQVGNYARKQLSFDIGDTLDDIGTVTYRLLGVGRDGNAQTGPLSLIHI